MKTDSERAANVAGWGFWLRWVLGSGLGMLIGFAAAFALTGFVVETLLGESADAVLGEEGPPFFIALTIVFTVAGAGMGFMQWLVLRRHVPQAGGWVLASSLGFLVVGAMFGLLSGAVSEALNEIVHNVVGGAVAGTIQSRILRRQIRRAWWWIPASSIGFLVAGGVSGLLPEVPFSEVVGIVAMTAITGGVLVWLLSGLEREAAPAA